MIMIHYVIEHRGKIWKSAADALANYRDTLPTAQQSLLDRYELRDAAIKVVGIGQRRDHLRGVPLHGWRGRPPLPSGQGGARLGAGAVCRGERLSQSR
jgi:hypothetical protein